MDTKEAREKQVPTILFGLLYRMTVAFPSWAGVLAVLYALSVAGWMGWPFRPR